MMLIMEKEVGNERGNSRAEEFLRLCKRYHPRSKTSRFLRFVENCKINLKEDKGFLKNVKTFSNAKEYRDVFDNNLSNMARMFLNEMGVGNMKDKSKNEMQPPGFEPGPLAWEASVLPG